jgi:hypothetical protein
LTYAAAANTTALARSGTIIVAGQMLSVTQAAATGGAKLALSSSSLNFGTDSINDRSGAQRVLVSNTGNATLTLGTVGLAGAASDYADSGSCDSGLALVAGASCFLDITFDPTAAGVRAATLSVGIGGGSPGIVALTGTGTASASSDGPLPLWAVCALGALMLGLGARRLQL